MVRLARTIKYFLCVLFLLGLLVPVCFYYASLHPNSNIQVFRQRIDLGRSAMLVEDESQSRKFFHESVNHDRSSASAAVLVAHVERSNVAASGSSTENTSTTWQQSISGTSTDRVNVTVATAATETRKLQLSVRVSPVTGTQTNITAVRVSVNETDTVASDTKLPPSDTPTLPVVTSAGNHTTLTVQVADDSLNQTIAAVVAKPIIAVYVHRLVENNTIPAAAAAGEPVENPFTTVASTSTTTLSAAHQQLLIDEYLQDELRTCLKQFKNDTHPADYYCPCIPPNLKGRLAVDESENMTWSDIGESAQRENGKSGVNGSEWRVLSGGEWSPGWCVPRTHLAVLIPFRDRDSHLRVLLRHLLPILQRQLTHFRIFVIEQTEPVLFNRGALINVGFLEAEKLFPEMNCVMFHDVDSLLEDDRALMRCRDVATHYALVQRRWDYIPSYSGYHGGVLSMPPEAYRKLDGFYNGFFGWGGEDDDMSYRIWKYIRMTFRSPLALQRYTTLSHGRDSTNPENMQRSKILYEGINRTLSRIKDGLANTSYSVDLVESRAFYTYIAANISVDGYVYAKHNVSQYWKLPGECALSQEERASRSRDVSRVTCQYLCDVPPVDFAVKNCVGFTYYELTAAERVDGSTMSTCVWHDTLCRPATLNNNNNNNNRSVFTYFKIT